MSLASDLLSVLGNVRSHFASQVNSGLLVTLDDHIAQIASVVEHDVAAAEERAKDVLGALYTALHGHPTTPAVPDPAPVQAAPPQGPTVPAPALLAPAPTEPVQAVAVSPAPDATEAVSPAFDAAEAPAAETTEADTEQAPAS